MFKDKDFALYLFDFARARVWNARNSDDEKFDPVIKKTPLLRTRGDAASLHSSCECWSKYNEKTRKPESAETPRGARKIGKCQRKG